MTTIVSLDPGGTTGYAVYETTKVAFDIGQIGPEEHHSDLFDLLRDKTDRGSIVVCESFEFRQNRQRDNINLMSREYIGVVKLFRDMTFIPVVFQTAGTAKPFVTDEKLKVMGLWTPGKGHAMDAMRHLIYFMVTKQRRHDLIESWKEL